VVLLGLLHGHRVGTVAQIAALQVKSRGVVYDVVV
jgi:hypothetical protein